MVDAPVNIIPATGSPVLELVLGGCYHLEGLPGAYSIVQFNSSEELVVREVSSGTLSQVHARLLRPLQTSDNTRERDLQVVESNRIESAKQIYEAIKPLLAYSRIPSDVVEARAKETSRSAKTLKKWIRRYRKDPRLSSLTRKRRSDAGDVRFDPLVEKELALAVRALLADSNLRLIDAHGDLVDAVKELQRKLGRKLKAPSYGTFYSRFNALSEKEKAEARLGKRPARLKHGLQKGSLQDIDHPLAIVQVDHLEVPVVVVDEEFRLPIGKAWITVLIDVFSRCIVGYYLTLEAPSNLSLGLAMIHGIQPKDETLALLDTSSKWPISGFMWAVHADNAGEFHGNMIELAANEYLIDLMFRKVREPNYGAYIESYLGTLSDELRRLPGSTREGPEALGETDPNESAAMTLTDLEKYILSLIMTYHNTPHSGLNHMTPLGRFAEGMRGGSGMLPVGRLRQATDPQKLRLDFLPCDERCVSPKGIVWDYVWYSDDCLQRWVNSIDPENRDEKRKFLLRRDPRDLSRIYFWEPEEEQYRIIGTRNISRPSITLWELNAIREHLKARGVEHVDEDMIFSGREERRKLREQAVAKTNAAKSRRARDAERERRAKQYATSSPAKEQDAKAKDAPAGETPPSNTVTGVAFSLEWGD